MKGLSFAVVVTIFLVFVCAVESYGYTSETWRQQLKSIAGRISGHHHDRIRRQSSDNCTNAENEFLSDEFQYCFGVFENLGDLDFTNDELQEYCDKNCNSEIIRVLTDYAVYCDNGAGVSNTIDTTLSFCNIKRM